jgi:hypothetical protein
VRPSTAMSPKAERSAPRWPGSRGSSRASGPLPTSPLGVLPTSRRTVTRPSPPSIRRVSRASTRTSASTTFGPRSSRPPRPAWRRTSRVGMRSTLPRASRQPLSVLQSRRRPRVRVRARWGDDHGLDRPEGLRGAFSADCKTIDGTVGVARRWL